MEWLDRKGNIVPGNDTESRFIKFLYETKLGQLICSILIKKWVSELAGKIMDMKISCIAIHPFLKNSNINMNEYEQVKFKSFNDFFTRKIKKECRPIDMDEKHLISPCDCKFSVYDIKEDSTFMIKNTNYTLESLLQNKELAEVYKDGTFLLFRLTVDDYHRYAYIDSGMKTKNVYIPGVYYTVNPIANDHKQIYKENSREYTIIENETFGKILMMEVGATMVGRIVNYDQECVVTRGQEKGRFEFGGSTIIVCIEKDKIIIDDDLVKNTKQGNETVLKLGEKIGIAN